MLQTFYILYSFSSTSCRYSGYQMLRFQASHPVDTPGINADTVSVNVSTFRISPLTFLTTHRVNISGASTISSRQKSPLPGSRSQITPRHCQGQAARGGNPSLRCRHGAGMEGEVPARFLEPRWQLQDFRQSWWWLDCLIFHNRGDPGKLYQSPPSTSPPGTQGKDGGR